MEADWEVEIGGGAPVIEALWPGFVDLRAAPERIVEITEAAAFSPLAGLLLALNGPGSPVWTSKCDHWEPEPRTVAIYIDMLPREGAVFAEWDQAEVFCREYVGRLQMVVLPETEPACTISLVIRQAIAGKAEGFGITAYLSAKGSDRTEASAGLAKIAAAFAGALPALNSPAAWGSKLQ
ncbi:MAG: hypothetical protein WA802_12770 [Terracidiphilus sp.]